jgi:hypothetical protein
MSGLTHLLKNPEHPRFDLRVELVRNGKWKKGAIDIRNKDGTELGTPV